MINQKAVVFTTLLLIARASATPPPKLEIQTVPENGPLLTAHDRANGSWILEISHDLIHWADSGQTVNVRNSILPVRTSAVTGEKSPTYFRLASLPEAEEKTVKRTLALPPTPYPYALSATAPANLARGITAANIDDAKAALGRVLFYDRRLSLDNSVSCASCHRQDHAFADGVALSPGHRNVLTVRNSVSLQHARTYSKGAMIFWDGRGKTLDVSVLEPISHPEEMGLSLEKLAAKISAEPYYNELFTAIYGTSRPSSQKVGECIGDFVESMVSFRSKYDTGSVGAYANFTKEEIAGKSIFSSRCGSCHTPGSFTNGAFSNNGLELTYLDRGRAALTGLAADEGKFRTPSLRQVALTAPYMHDGRFATLREVIDFYDHGVVPHRNLSKPLTAQPMNLKESDKLALEAFLKTLTDTSLMENPAFSDPFRNDLEADSRKIQRR